MIEDMDTVRKQLSDSIPNYNCRILPFRDGLEIVIIDEKVENALSSSWHRYNVLYPYLPDVQNIFQKAFEIIGISMVNMEDVEYFLVTDDNIYKNSS